jgi:crossover junction endodeoxyribonuclease RusA
MDLHPGVYLPATRRVRDPANWYPSFKAAIDGLTDKKCTGQVLTVGVLSDDSDEHVVGPDMRLGDVVTRPHVTILIWDLTRRAGSAAGEAADAR